MRKAQTVTPRSFSAAVVIEFCEILTLSFSSESGHFLSLGDCFFVLEISLICAGIGHMHFWRKCSLMGRS